jgi:hypothetical protein
LMAMVEILEGIRISASRIKVVLAIEGIWVRQKFMMKASTTHIGVLTLTRGLAMWVVVIRRGLKSEIPMVIRERERETLETRCEEIRTMAGWGQEDHLIASTVTEMVTSRHHVPIPHSATIAKKMDIGPWHAQPRKDSI